MGQFFFIVNTNKKEFLHPHVFGDGSKLMEFGCSAMGTMTALALLLRRSSETGGGDWMPQYYGGENKRVGSWAGDSIVIIGAHDDSGLYDEAHNTFTNISSAISKPSSARRMSIVLRRFNKMSH